MRGPAGMGTAWARRRLPRRRGGLRWPGGERAGGNLGQAGPGAGRDGGRTEMGSAWGLIPVPA